MQHQFIAFRKREGPLFGPGSPFGDDVKPYDFWLRLSTTDFKLACLARRIFSTLANSVPSERSFSAIKFLQNCLRNRLTPDRTDQSAFIFINAKVLERVRQLRAAGSQSAAPVTPSDRWETVKEVVLMEMEDEHQALYGDAPSEADLIRIIAMGAEESDDGEWAEWS